ncbi:uncharacterized protein TRIADDRAFT_28070 [Trichoplax adhaerens]|uniref:HECT-type E3 ubiquitin transferase n=1 Tax=Trichoplax adhaerens TaxID=10228 RepID=B3S1K7_TRIAD|nr:hypothetical protein TRIADDRAFT_28070 [Trichoplax adhaerens]EDV23245.1 hypothetical protein TRIADDRAFT_28070 [Trichoplax adhaerens]|eukprot:XP_002114155.1 hypothetical protein TRIADDRAFT_28070 [Trichoplax adhaerens]
MYRHLLNVVYSVKTLTIFCEIHELAIEIFNKMRWLLFIFQDDVDSKRLEMLCHRILSNMTVSDSPKLWYVTLAISNQYLPLWLYQAKKLLQVCSEQLANMKINKKNELEAMQLYLTVLVTFSSTKSWKLMSSKANKNFRPILDQICKQVLLHLVNNNFFANMKNFLWNCTRSGELKLSKVTLSGVIVLIQRTFSASSNNLKLLKQFMESIMAFPALLYHVKKLSPEASLSLAEFRQSHVLEVVLETYADGSNLSNLTTKLGGYYTFSLLGNLIQLSHYADKVSNLENNVRRNKSIIMYLLNYCHDQNSVKNSNATVHHPLFGWCSEALATDLQDSVPLIGKQFQYLWMPSAVQLFFTDIFEKSDETPNEAAASVKTGDSVKKKKGLFGRVFSKSQIKGFILSSTKVKTNSDLIKRICSTCAMYNTAISTLPEMRTDVLTGISYYYGLLEPLWKFIHTLYMEEGPKIFHENSPNLSDTISLTTLFCNCCCHLITIVDDIELYQENKPFTLDELIKMVTLLNHMVFYAIWKLDGAKYPYEYRQMINAGHMLLMVLYDRDCRRSFTPENHWIIKELNFNEFISALNEGTNRSHVLLRKIAHVIPREKRVDLFRKLVADDKKSLGIFADTLAIRPNYTYININRSRLLEDGYEQLTQLPPEAIKRTIKVQFVNEQGLTEAGIDESGVFKEFLEETIKKAFDPALNLFKVTCGDEPRLYPSPTSYIHGNHLPLFEFVGRMLGKAVYEGLVVEVPLALFFLNNVLGGQHSILYSCIDELPSLDPELYKNLNYVKNYEDDVEDLALTFSFDEDVLGKIITHDLKYGGSTIPVTNENKLSYIHLMAHFRLRKQLKKQTAAFIRGFHSVIKPEWLQVFSGPELQLLIAGENTTISILDLKKYTKYLGGYHSKHRVIQWLWDILKNDFGEEDRCKFLKFVTSCSKPPLQGFSNLQPPFTIRYVEAENEEDRESISRVLFRALSIPNRKSQSTSRLPTSSTCFNLLKLPNYHSKHVLREKLRYAIQSNSGFELS